MTWQRVPGGWIRYGETLWGGKAGPSRYTEFKDEEGRMTRVEGHLSAQEVLNQLRRMRNATDPTR